MITKHSIDLTHIKEPCFALTRDGECRVVIMPDFTCGTHKCPFYKPIDCKDWVRIEDRQGVNLIPPEEAYGKKERY